MITKPVDDERQRKPTLAIHALIIAYFNLVSKLYEIPEFSQHVDQVNRLNSNIKLYFIYLDNLHS